MSPPARPVTMEERLEVGRRHALAAWRQLRGGPGISARVEGRLLVICLTTPETMASTVVDVEDCGDAALVKARVLRAARSMASPS